MGTKLVQKGVRLEDSEYSDLVRMADREGRTEQDILRRSLHLYVRTSDDHQAFMESVSRGYIELESGFGDVVDEKDTFFDELRREISGEKNPTVS